MKVQPVRLSTLYCTNPSPVEHNVPADQSSSQPPPRRPDLSTFFSALEHVDTSGSRAPQNQHALPHPVDISAAFRTLANSFAMMQPGPAASTDTTQPQTHVHHQDGQNDLLSRLVEELLASAEDPPREVEGVSDDFLAGLDRIPKARIKQEDSCPICGNPFLDDKYPLVASVGEKKGGSKSGGG
ncbi:MAG: hypothetical protein Q9165_002877 [Trypethelium subeluteriae]